MDARFPPLISLSPLEALPEDLLEVVVMDARFSARATCTLFKRLLDDRRRVIHIRWSTWDSRTEASVVDQVSSLLANLPNLVVLNGSSYNYGPRPTWISAAAAALHTIDLSHSTAISDLSPLAACANLTDLNLCQCPAITDISPLAACSSLTSVKLRSCQVRDVSALQLLPALALLDLCGTCATDIRPLGHCASLTDLDISQIAYGTGHTRQGLADISALASCSRLATLTLLGHGRHTRVHYLQHPPALATLSNLHGLRTLHLAGRQSYQLSNIGPICSLTGLLRLQLRHGRAPLQPLQACTSLLSLAICDWPVHTDVSFLRTIGPTLQTLAIVDCGSLVDISDVACCSGLETLDLSGCSSVRSIAPVTACAGLRKIWLRYCCGLVDTHKLRACRDLHFISFTTSSPGWL